ncbi:MAG: hypothetical protein HQL82_06760 [Magnetococcales bacterium]|nr:hypothetical protein [Magnetococcales bacterium]
MRWLLVVILLGGWWSAAPMLAGEDGVDAFLGHHWARPLAFQGTPPAVFPPLEASLRPEDCGQCHASQYAEWKTSHHSRAMSPGILGQLLAMPATAREEHQACLRCHAPLAEQAESLVAVLSGNEHSFAPQASHLDGLTCAGCHVRRHQRFGPPARGEVSKPASHGGWVASTAFEDARFCAACHQFEEDDPALNGKLLENTYQEWRQSRYPQAGASCQTCHMPDHRHLWRGIHDPTLVREGVTLTTEPLSTSPGEAGLRLSLRNTGVGHHFPTYVTPRVIMEVWQQDERGKRLEGTHEAYIIARDVTLDLNREISDTRLPPDGEAVLEYRRSRHVRAATLAWRVRVEPDAFYLRFYRAVLEMATIHPAEGNDLLRQAIHLAEASPYTLFGEERRLPAR